MKIDWIVSAFCFVAISSVSIPCAANSIDTVIQSLRALDTRTNISPTVFRCSDGEGNCDSELPIRFVATDGDDNAPGTIEKPWRSIASSVNRLSGGGMLYLRGGTYYESRIVTASADKNNENILLISSFPNENVVINADLNASQFSKPNQWTLFNETANVWRIKLEDDKHRYVTGKLVTSDGMPDLPLITYMSNPERRASGLSDLASSEHKVSESERYVGPGLLLENGWLYIRLDHPQSSGSSEHPLLLELTTNPNNHEIALAAPNAVFSIRRDNVHLQSITLIGATKSISLDDDIHNFSLKDVSLAPNALAVDLGEGASEINLENLTILGHHPPWLAWSDIKGTDGQSKPASHWSNRFTGIAGSNVNGMRLISSDFKNVFDGLVLSGRNVQILGNTGNFVDDMIQLGSDSSNIEIAYNYIEGAGPSHNARKVTGKEGSVYIYHNVIDSTNKVLFGRADPDRILRNSYSGFVAPQPFPAHGKSALVEADPWKIYANTIIFDSTLRSRGTGHGLWSSENTRNETHEVYNNIFIDIGTGYFAGSIDMAAAGQMYDGNVYYRTGESGTLYNLVIDSMPINITDLTHLKTFFEENSSRLHFDTHWDTRSIEINPELNSTYQPPVHMVNTMPSITLPSTFPGPRIKVRGALPARN